MNCKKCNLRPIHVIKRKLCTECNKDYNKEYWQKTKEIRIKQKTITKKNRRFLAYDFLRQYCLENPCEICKEDDYIVLEFDHLDRSTKRESISNLISKGLSLKVIKEELAKCRVLCANCHRRETAKQLGWYK